MRRVGAPPGPARPLLPLRYVLYQGTTLVLRLGHGRGLHRRSGGCAAGREGAVCCACPSGEGHTALLRRHVCSRLNDGGERCRSKGSVGWPWAWGAYGRTPRVYGECLIVRVQRGASCSCDSRVAYLQSCPTNERKRSCAREFVRCPPRVPGRRACRLDERRPRLRRGQHRVRCGLAKHRPRSAISAGSPAAIAWRGADRGWRPPRRFGPSETGLGGAEGGARPVRRGQWAWAEHEGGAPRALLATGARDARHLSLRVRHPQAAAPPAAWRRGRDCDHTAPRLLDALRVVPGGLPAGLHLLRDGHDGAAALPHRR